MRTKRVIRRFGCNLTAPDTPLRVDVGSDDCVSAGLVDEWLQARNELSIEIFLQHTRFGRSPRLLRLKASATASSGGLESTAASMRRPASWIGRRIVIQSSMRRTCTATRLA